MNGETDVNTGLMNEEEEHTIEKEDNQEKSNLSREQSTVIMTDEEFVKVATPDREMGKEGSGLSELGSSPLGSFQVLQSSKSSESDKMIPYVPPLGEVKILQFEDTLSEDHKNVNLIYESLLLEGKAGNLTNLTLGMKNLCHGYRSCMKG